MAGSSGSATRKAQRNKEMAAEMKRLKIDRHTGNCPCCHELIGLKGMMSHIMRCGGARTDFVPKRG